MARAEPHRERIGDMLVAAGLVTTEQLAAALDAQGKSGVRIGKQLVAMGVVTELQVTQVLSNQLSIPWVSLERIEFSERLLSLIPGEIADRYTVMPIYVRRLREQGDTLYIAMDDPTDEEAVARISARCGYPVRAMIASPSDIRRAIEARYFGHEDEWPRERSAVKPAPAPASAPAAPALAPTSAESSEAGRALKVRPPPPPVKNARPEGVVPVEHYEVPSDPPRGAATRTLTLLDGTKIALPQAGRAAGSGEVREVRHVVKAVRAASNDLGLEAPPRWHDLVQVLIDALSARGMHFTRKEVAEAWAKRHGGDDDGDNDGEKG
jgi:type IV pilus assembly protein PilB